ncbi:hypothetical protein VM1G_12004 [Cytospora mali]|uniref:Uncharacterized protein n=1 Tax=Cytospora mali TaxID=578113 RepID=A0A194VHI1_CYTMA|nr:hypothetical protein VM1G_12004 [Valsa mali]
MIINQLAPHRTLTPTPSDDDDESSYSTSASSPSTIGTEEFIGAGAVNASGAAEARWTY